MTRIGRTGWLQMLAVMAICASWIAFQGTGVFRKSQALRLDRPAEQMHPRLLRLAALDMRGGVGAIKWLDMLTYFGGNIAAKRKNMNAVWMYRSIVSQAMLNPYHLDLYYFSGAVFSTTLKRPEMGARLLQYGVSHRTADWRILFTLGYLLASEFDHSDYAMDVWQIGSALPDAPQYLAALTVMHGYKEDAIERNLLFLDQMIVDWRGSESYRLELLGMRTALWDLLQLQRLVDIYAQRTGREPGDIRDIPGFWSIVPTGRDPFGGVYRYDTQEKRVVTTSPDLLPKNLRGDRKKLPPEFFQWKYARNLLERLTMDGPTH